MGFCLLLFLMISASLSTYMMGNGIRERIVVQELPAVVGEIRNDILRQISEPLASSLSVANNTFLLDWEKQGLPDTGIDAWQRYSKLLKDKLKAATVFWVSGTSGKYFNEAGLNRTLSRDAASDQWFYSFLSGGKPYTLDIDKDVGSNAYMLFINASFDADGKKGVTGLGLPVDALAHAIRSYHIGKSGFVYLVRANGSLLIHKDPALVDGKHFLKDLPGFNEALSKQLLNQGKFTHAGYTSPQGTQIVASSYVPELNLYVIAEMP